MLAGSRQDHHLSKVKPGALAFDLRGEKRIQRPRHRRKQSAVSCFAAVISEHIVDRNSFPKSMYLYGAKTTFNQKGSNRLGIEKPKMFSNVVKPVLSHEMPGNTSDSWCRQQQNSTRIQSLPCLAQDVARISHMLNKIEHGNDLKSALGIRTE